MSKKCLILSQGPVLVPEHPTVEGGGLRCWGLARGIKMNEQDVEVTVAYHESYAKKPITREYEGILVTTWEIGSIAKLIQEYDCVIVSYCMGDLSVQVADHIRPDQQLILDCYVPIYVEVSARNSNDIDREYAAFRGDVQHWAHVLKRGDLFLCSSEAQKEFYMGVLSGLGRINPITYGSDLIRVVPYGVYREAPKATARPIDTLIGKNPDDYKKILWFGGIYPWFDLKQLVDAITIVNETVPAKLVIVGAKNPFNSHPDFVRPYEELVQHINTSESTKQQVILQDWVDFETRADWYLNSDLVVVMNKLGEENKLAWRTRLVDFVWADLPVVTNGGDPLGEALLTNKAASRLHGTDAKTIAVDLTGLLDDAKTLGTMHKSMAEFKKTLYWDLVTKQLAQDVKDGTRAIDLQEYGTYAVASRPAGGKIGAAKRAVAKARMIPAYSNKYGLRNTYHALRTTVRNQVVKTPRGARTSPKIVMIAHQLDMSGAPFVFLDLTKQIVTDTSSSNMEFHTFNPAAKDNIRLLNKLGIKPLIHLSKDVSITFVKGDSIVLNTVAHSIVLKESMYRALEQNVAKHLAWFVHEDEPDLIFGDSEAKRLKALLASNKITMFIAAEKTLQNYQKFFDNTENIRLQPYKYVIEKKFTAVLQPTDFEKLRFILPGTVSDGRKGQLPIFYALGEFLSRYYQADPTAYRDFDLTYVGVEDDFLSRQILNHADKLLGVRFIPVGRVSHDESERLITDSNVTICYSLRECLPLFVFEGMAAGHPVLRNDCSGMEEQLFEGQNGFYLESSDFEQLVKTFEQVLNKAKTSDRQLSEMSKFSNKVAVAQADHSYQPMVDIIISNTPSLEAKKA